MCARSNPPLEHGDRGLGSNVDLDEYMHTFYVCVVLCTKGLSDGPNPRLKGPTKYLQKSIIIIIIIIIIIVSKDTGKSKHKELFGEKGIQISGLLF